ncbi:MAG: hypothetical protein ACOCWA_05035, partial [Bacteroidota bacterium]
HDVESLFERLKSAGKKRPLITGMSKSKLFNYIRDTLALREKYYNKAQIIVEAKSLKPKELEAKVREYLAENPRLSD